MNPRTNPLAELLVQHQNVLADGLVEGLAQSSAQSYRNLDRDLLRERALRLVQALAQSAAGDPAAIVTHVRELAAQRMAAGFRLEEIHLALTCSSASAGSCCSPTSPAPSSRRARPADRDDRRGQGPPGALLRAGARSARRQA